MPAPSPIAFSGFWRETAAIKTGLPEVFSHHFASYALTGAGLSFAFYLNVQAKRAVMPACYSLLAPPCHSWHRKAPHFMCM